MSLQATIIRDILQSAAARGASYEQLCQLTGLKNEEISRSENKVDWEKVALIWNPLLELTGDAQIGLHIGNEMKLSMLGMVGFLMQSSKDLEQAFRTFCHYSPLVAPMVDFLYVEKDAVAIEMYQNKMWQHTYPETARQASDFAVAAIVRFLSSLSGKTIRPQEVCSEYSRCHVSEYERVLGAPVRFGTPVTKVVLRKEDMNTPVISNDQSLFQLFDSILTEKKAARLASTYTESLKQLLFLQFKGQIPAMEEAASALNLSPRSLQRKLLEERTTFRSIANDVRKELALELMKNPAAKLSDVSDVLGYGDVTAFRRAFKSWTKERPKAVQLKLKEGHITGLKSKA